MRRGVILPRPRNVVIPAAGSPGVNFLRADKRTLRGVGPGSPNPCLALHPPTHTRRGSVTPPYLTQLHDDDRVDSNAGKRKIGRATDRSSPAPIADRGFPPDHNPGRLHATRAARASVKSPSGHFITWTYIVSPGAWTLHNRPGQRARAGGRICSPPFLHPSPTRRSLSARADHLPFVIEPYIPQHVAAPPRSEEELTQAFLKRETGA